MTRPAGAEAAGVTRPGAGGAARVRLLLDADTGVDDALAILYLARSPEVELLGVGTVFGNIDAGTAAWNTLRALEAAGRTDVPVAVGAARPLLAPPVAATWVHGEDGLGNTFMPPPRGQPARESAAGQILRVTRAHPGEVVLCAVGPLTNLALALALDPGLPERVKRVVVMGGVVRRGGNTGPVQEANVWHDPEAARMVYRAGWPLTQVGLDVTMETFLTGEHLAALAAAGEAGNGAAAFAARIVPHYLGVYQRFLGEAKCAMHDPLAAGVALDPSYVRCAELHVDVETGGGLTRGMTVADLRGLVAPALVREKPNVQVALEVDAGRFMADWMARILG